MIDMITEPQAYDLFREHGIPVADYKFWPAERSTPNTIPPFDPPFFAKAIVSGVGHKSDLGLVRRINSQDDYKRTIDILTENAERAEGKFQGILFQRAVEGTEIIIGVKNDETFGSVISLSEGGAYTDLREPVLDIPPLDRKGIETFVDSHPFVGKVLSKDGFRGRKLYRDGVIDMLESLLQMLENSDKTIEELDLNPVIVNDIECLACDGVVGLSDRIKVPPRPIRSDLHEMLNPESVVVFGASREEGKLGNHIAKNVKKSGAKHYFVRPDGQQILNEDSFTSLVDIGENINLAIIALNASLVPGTLDECGRNGIKNVLVVSSGFGEVSDDSEEGSCGKKLQREIKQLAQSYGINLWGPNGMGFWTPYINTFFVSETRPLGDKNYRTIRAAKKGGATILAQSGAMAMHIVDNLVDAGIGFACSASYGNGDMLDSIDLLDYFKDDDDTSVITLYMEGLDPGRGRDFIDVAYDCSLEKPIVVLKPGKSEGAQRGTITHTGSKAGKAEIYSAAFRKAGVVEAHSISELVDKTVALSTQPVARSNKIVIASNTGGFGSMLSDFCKQYNLDVEPIDSAYKQKLKEKMPGIASPENPIDFTTVMKDHDVGDALDQLKDYEDMGGLIFVMYHGGPGETGDEILPYTRKVLRNLSDNGIPVCVFDDMTTPLGRKIRESFMHDDIPVFASGEGAVRGMSALVEYGSFLKKNESYVINTK